MRPALPLLVAALLAGCHSAADTPAPATNAAAVEADLEQQANAMEAQADAAADRNVADVFANRPDPAQANAATP